MDVRSLETINTIPFDELIAIWRKWGKRSGNMHCIRKNVLNKINLPEETRLFLNQAGLTDAIYAGSIFPTLPRLTEIDIDLPDSLSALPASFSRYRVIGAKGYCFDCLDEEADGKIYVILVGSELDLQVRFRNTSIVHYAKCCLAWSYFITEAEDQRVNFTSTRWLEWVDRYAQIIKEIDPPALADDKTWYALKLEDLKEGWL